MRAKLADYLRISPPHGRSVSGWFLCLAWLALGWCGCRHTPIAPETLPPGGVVQQGQAVWKPTATRPEIAGELFLRRWPDGSFLVRFEKTPFVILEARRSSTQWSIAFPGTRQYFKGRGQPHQRFAWLYLPSALAGEQIPAPFILSFPANGAWRLENAETGEVLTGYLQPRSSPTPSIHSSPPNHQPP